VWEGDQKEKIQMKERELEINIEEKKHYIAQKRELHLAHKQLKNEGIAIDKITSEVGNPESPRAYSFAQKVTLRIYGTLTRSKLYCHACCQANPLLHDKCIYYHQQPQGKNCIVLLPGIKLNT
jgi:hypothetical protein